MCSLFAPQNNTPYFVIQEKPAKKALVTILCTLLMKISIAYHEV